MDREGKGSVQCHTERRNKSGVKACLTWSLAVNEAISKMPPAKPFDGAKEAIIKASGEADIVVVSSTNPDALDAEWSNAGLRSYVSAIMSHRDGPKKECIAKLIKMGYQPENVIMLGMHREITGRQWRMGCIFIRSVREERHGTGIYSRKQYFQCLRQECIEKMRSKSISRHFGKNLKNRGEGPEA